MRRILAELCCTPTCHGITHTHTHTHARLSSSYPLMHMMHAPGDGLHVPAGALPRKIERACGCPLRSDAGEMICFCTAVQIKWERGGRSNRGYMPLEVERAFEFPLGWKLGERERGGGRGGSDRGCATRNRAGLLVNVVFDRMRVWDGMCMYLSMYARVLRACVCVCVLLCLPLSCVYMCVCVCVSVFVLFIFFVLLPFMHACMLHVVCVPA